MPNAEVEHPVFDVAGKGRGWHTAFYYLAEHVRFLTGGAINHKALYALVGANDCDFNHENPKVRKRTAGALSRVVHSSRYARDMRTAFSQDSSLFRRAALEVCTQAGFNRSLDDEAIANYLEKDCWPDVLKGLQNEKLEWRGDLDLARIDLEARTLFSEEGTLLERLSTDGLSAASVMLSGLFHIVAFGHLDFEFARSLVDEEPTGVFSGFNDGDFLRQDACLVKFSNSDRKAFAGMWHVPTDRPLTVGRYTDCDVVEEDRALSRLHCCLYRKAGTWRFEDLGSRNGSRVLREGEGCVFDSSLDGSRLPFELSFGDEIVLADRSCYWFGALTGAVKVTTVHGGNVTVTA